MVVLECGEPGEQLPSLASFSFPPHHLQRAVARQPGGDLNVRGVQRGGEFGEVPGRSLSSPSAVSTVGSAAVHFSPAHATDRDAAKEVLFRLRLMHPEYTIVWADSGYAGRLVTWAKAHLNLTLKTTSRPKDATGFVILPRRWVVERSLAWIRHARRHARDYERLIQHSESLITWAAITLMTRRITRRSQVHGRQRHQDRPVRPARSLLSHELSSSR